MFVCLAGFMRIFTDAFIENWLGRIINIHPALLPSFKGRHAHELAIEAGVAISGCTVHFTVPELDSGAIIGQAAVPVRMGDTPQSLEARVLKAEHKLYPHCFGFCAKARFGSRAAKPCSRGAEAPALWLGETWLHSPQTWRRQT